MMHNPDDAAFVRPVPSSPLIRYYVSLLSDFQQHCLGFDQQCQQAVAFYARISHHLQVACDHARATGHIAANALFAAAGCGEVGRGFVKVSRDLSAISNQSGHDLQKLYNLVSRLQARLSLVQAIDHAMATHWIKAMRDQQPLQWDVEGLLDLGEYLDFAVGTIQEMQDRYLEDVRLDVRWLQLGDAVKRVLSDIADNLFNLRQTLELVLSEWRLLGVSQQLELSQLAELENYFDSFRVSWPELT